METNKMKPMGEVSFDFVESIIQNQSVYQRVSQSVSESVSESANYFASNMIPTQYECRIRKKLNRTKQNNKISKNECCIILYYIILRHIIIFDKNIIEQLTHCLCSDTCIDRFVIT